MKLNEEHLGSRATKDEAIAMVEKLKARGYDVEYGSPGRDENLDEIPNAEWQEVLKEVIAEAI